MSEEQASEITINVKGPSELKLQITITTDKSVLDLKQAIAAKSEVEADRQRLIYSGRVLKDDDALSVYKIQSSHTIHMVKGVSRSSAGSSSGSPSTPQQLPPMQAGQNVHDPLTQMNSHLGYGMMAGFNPFADLGLNTNDPNFMQSMFDSPQFLQQMSSLMSNPAIMDQVIASNPQLANMPQVRETFQSPAFRDMISNPESLRQMFQMSSMLQQAGLGPGAFSPWGSSSFPTPGAPVTNTNTPSATSPSTSPSSQTSGNTGPGSTPPLPNLFSAGGIGTGTPSAPGAPNPFFNPALLHQMLAGGSFGGGIGTEPQSPVADTRSPEERFQTQLQQLQEMGFINASQNVRALLATGGNVQSAIEYILGGGGL